MDELRIGMLVSLVRNEVDLQGVGDGVLKRRRRTNKRRKKESFKMFDLINSERASQWRVVDIMVTEPTEFEQSNSGDESLFPKWAVEREVNMDMNRLEGFMCSHFFFLFFFCEIHKQGVRSLDWVSETWELGFLFLWEKGPQCMYDCRSWINREEYWDGYEVNCLLLTSCLIRVILLLA